MSESNKKLVRRWFEEVWNKGRADAIDEMFSDDGIAHGLSDDSEKPLRGPADFRTFHAQFREAFPNITVTVEDAIAEDDKVVALFGAWPTRRRQSGIRCDSVASGIYRNIDLAR
jgi:SnoaL-like polyketide cyclase